MAVLKVMEAPSPTRIAMAVRVDATLVALTTLLACLNTPTHAPNPIPTWQPATGPVPVLTIATTGDSLPGTSSILVSLGSASNLRTPSKEAKSTIEFTEDRHWFSGRSSCNLFESSYLTGSLSFDIRGLRWTAAECHSAELDEQETIIQDTLLGAYR